ncbi:MAG: hypothetical protein JWP81_216 [Ferruginibacter sp.]|nr:hypothetical protein [Ferruginibacter sp.]
MSPKFFLKKAIVFFCLLCQLASNAQVCSGALGDPVVNVSFGSGANPGGQLQAASTTYTFTSAPCPPDGSYTVVNNTAGCFGSTWHTLPEDHTPNDNNGYMMLVNASFNPGDFYVDTVKNLCANTTYEFAAWVLNVLLPTACSPNPISPKLVFNIETTNGSILGTYSTGDIPSTSAPSWKQYGLFFTTPFNTNSVVIRLTNTAPGGCGNDLALDDITFRPCGPAVIAGVGVNNEKIVDVCKGNVPSMTIAANIGTGYIAPALQWQHSANSGVSWSDITGATSLSYPFNQTATGAYQYRLTASEGTNTGLSSCRVASNTVVITIHDLPAVTAAGNSPVCEKQPINLSAAGATNYTWTGPAGYTSILASPSFAAKSNSGGQYNVTGTDQFGCSNAASVNVVVYPKPVVTIIGTQKYCVGNSVILLAGGGVTYLWSPSKGLSNVNIPNPVASPVDTTTYSVIIAGTNNCYDTAIVIVNVIKKPTANAGPDKILLKGQQVILEGVASGSNTSVNWLPVSFLDNPLMLQPAATPLNDIRYVLSVVSKDGCGSATDDVFVKVYNDIYVPTAFSPNKDGINDTWHIEALTAVPNAKVLVFNRYGKIVFETTGSNEQWNGTFKGQALPTGSYVYMIDLKNGRPLKKGTVTIMR